MVHRFQQTACLKNRRLSPNGERLGQVRHVLGHVVVDVGKGRPCLDVRSNLGDQLDACAQIKHGCGVGSACTDVDQGTPEGECIDVIDMAGRGSHDGRS